MHIREERNRGGWLRTSPWNRPASRAGRFHTSPTPLAARKSIAIISVSYRAQLPYPKETTVLTRHLQKSLTHPPMQPSTSGHREELRMIWMVHTFEMANCAPLTALLAAECRRSESSWGIGSPKELRSL